MRKVCCGSINFSKGSTIAGLAAIISGHAYSGKWIAIFEDRFARYIGCKHAISVSSGKMALNLILKTLLLNPGEEIIVPAFTVPEVIDIIINRKLRPVFVDIEFETYNIDPDLLEKKISVKTKAILLTHIFGQSSQIERIISIAKKYKLEIIEDAAQACGAEYKNKKIGSFGRVGYFSFGSLKNLNTVGGGMIVTNDTALAEKIRQKIGNFRRPSLIKCISDFLCTIVISILTHPVLFSLLTYPLLCLLRFTKYKNASFFQQAEFTKEKIDKDKVKYANFQAAIGVIQLKNIKEYNTKKQHNAYLFNRLLKEEKQIKTFPELKDSNNVYLNYVIRVDNRDKLIKRLFLKGIYLSKGAIRSCPNIKRFSEFYSPCPKSLILEKQNIYLPIHPLIREKDVFRIADLLKEAVKEG